MNHKKHTAKQNAAEKMTERDHLPESPAMPLSEKQITQGRFPGETALTGEDRPVDETGQKKEGFDQDKTDIEAATGHPAGRRPGDAAMPRPRPSSRDTQKR